jgi:hypothetical protein
MPTTVTNLVFPLVPINPITQGAKASAIFLRQPKRSNIRQRERNLKDNCGFD